MSDGGAVIGGTEVQERPCLHCPGTVRLSASGALHSTPHCDPALFGLREYKLPFSRAEIEAAHPAQPEPTRAPERLQAPTARDTRVHGEVTAVLWEPCRPIVVCPWCRGDASSHAIGCWVTVHDECRQSESELRAGLRKHELEALGWFLVLGKSREPSHFWLRCQRTECGTLFHLRKPGPFATVTLLEHVRPIAGESPLEVRPEGLCFADTAALWKHAMRHGAGGGW